MTFLLGIFFLTTVIAAAAALSADYGPIQQRVLPWTAGILIGIGAFWILPEMAESRGWAPALGGVTAALAVLGLFDRFVYPICPFCAAGLHAHAEADETAHRHHTVTLTWPLLLFGCVHVFFDGWTIALAEATGRPDSAALSWAAAVHKIPDSLAIGLLAARLTASPRAALAAVALVQAVMAAGGALALAIGKGNGGWAEWSAIPACAFLLLFGLLTLRQEWRARGAASAMKTAAPGLVACAAAAVAGGVLR